MSTIEGGMVCSDDEEYVEMLKMVEQMDGIEILNPNNKLKFVKNIK